MDVFLLPSAGFDEVESSFESPYGEWKLSGIPADREFTATRRSRHELIADPREG
jgi:hypothetical protein